jgi:hypothetical protein
MHALDFDLLRKTPVARDPFTHLVVNKFIKPGAFRLGR